MKLSCESTGLGHRFQNKFLFRNLNFKAEQGNILLITGQNGSGKSTLLKILSGALSPTEGSVRFSVNGFEIDSDHLWDKIGFVSPYQELPEDLNLEELIEFQHDMAESVPERTLYQDLVSLFQMEADVQKRIRFFSTGMKQKARFVLNLGSNRPVWILDEPTSNLDPESFSRFWDFIRVEKKEKLVLVASNDTSEFGFADLTLSLTGMPGK